MNGWIPYGGLNILTCLHDHGAQAHPNHCEDSGNGREHGGLSPANFVTLTGSTGPCCRRRVAFELQKTDTNLRRLKQALETADERRAAIEQEFEEHAFSIREIQGRRDLLHSTRADLEKQIAEDVRRDLRS